MKHAWIAGALMVTLHTDHGLAINATNPDQGVVGVVPVFKTKKQALAFVKGTKHPIFKIGLGDNR
jgi:hypothetical protein